MGKIVVATQARFGKAEDEVFKTFPNPVITTQFWFAKYGLPS
jgi:hypothetical protein